MEEPYSDSWAKLEEMLQVEINPVKHNIVGDPRDSKPNKVISLATKAEESREERKKRQKDATSLVRKLQ